MQMALFREDGKAGRNLTTALIAYEVAKPRCCFTTFTVALMPGEVTDKCYHEEH